MSIVSAVCYDGIMTKTGRPPFVKGERRRPVSVSLGETEIEALRELSRIRGESQGVIVGKFILAALAREQRKAEK